MEELVIQGSLVSALAVLIRHVWSQLRADLLDLRWRLNQSMQLLRLAARRRYMTELKLSELSRSGIDINGAFAVAMAELDAEEALLLNQEPPSSRSIMRVAIETAGRVLRR